MKEIMNNCAGTRGENRVLLSLRDYQSLKETAYLLSNEANARHLRKSLHSLQENQLLSLGNQP